MAWVLIASFLWSSVLFGQVTEISTVVYSAVSGYTINYQMLDRSLYGKGDIAYREAQKKWRASLHLEYLAAIGIGVSIALENNGKQWYYYTTDVALAFAIREALRPIFYNLFGGRAWDKQPNTDWTYFRGWEKLTTAYVRLFAMGAVLAFKYFVLPLL